MTSLSGGRVPDDDDVNLPAIDLDDNPEPDADQPDRPDGHATTAARRTPRRWLAPAVVLLIGGLLGAYLANLRTDTQAAGAVSVQLGGFEVQPWNATPGEPFRVGINLLNTGSREVLVVDVSIPGLDDEELGRRGSDSIDVAIPPGEWGTVAVYRRADCPVDRTPVRTRSFGGFDEAITVEVEQDGRRATVTTTGPQTARAAVDEALTNACTEPFRDDFFVEFVAAEIGEPDDGALPIRWIVRADARATDEITSVTSTTPGLMVEVAGLPIDPRTTDEIDATWTVDCDAVDVATPSMGLDVESETSNGETRRGSAWVPVDQAFALGGFVAQTCGPEDAGS